MSLPPLTTLPATLQGLAARAQTAWPTAVAALGGRCAERFASWPAARLARLGRVLAATDTKLKSGGVEGSNVQPIVETTELVDILRSYQSSMKMADAMNDMRLRAIGRLSKLG